MKSCKNIYEVKCFNFNNYRTNFSVIEYGAILSAYFTMIFTLVSYFLQVDPHISFGIYIIGISALKGVLCKELKEVFNLRKTGDIYNTTGLSDSVVSFIIGFIVVAN